MLYSDLTGKILEASFEVSKELGAGFLESVYEKALIVALTQKGMSSIAQMRLQVRFREVMSETFLPICLSKEKCSWN